MVRQPPRLRRGQNGYHIGCSMYPSPYQMSSLRANLNNHLFGNDLAKAPTQCCACSVTTLVWSPPREIGLVVAPLSAKSRAIRLSAPCIAALDEAQMSHPLGVLQRTTSVAPDYRQYPAEAQRM
ncbi:hypothetical protein SAMD00023353_9000270 [Rosellinia necatrix]|uniref:Uncharacterized protein n=1 Tax=Rosellinia necatrix TaxID=77044 RepID=A0A1W2TW37_ROSNE|nr:hypothetical protein SAMD00023353_9000270 [Rosellinia necatrix]